MALMGALCRSGLVSMITLRSYKFSNDSIMEYLLRVGSIVSIVLGAGWQYIDIDYPSLIVLVLSIAGR
jgi:hypothetical protein